MGKWDKQITRRNTLFGLAASSGVLAMGAPNFAMAGSVNVKSVDHSLTWTPAWRLREMMVKKTL